MLQQPFGVFATALLRFPKLVIAAVNGPAVGVGVTLLPQCDVVYALSGNPRTTDVSAGDEERRRGLRTEGGGARVEAASFWTPFFRLAIVPEFCSSVTFPKIMVSFGVYFSSGGCLGYVVRHMLRTGCTIF